VARKKVRAASGPRADVNLQEIKNAEKQLQTSEMESQKLTHRFEQVSDPQYLLDLKERIVALNHRIKKMGKNKKNLEVEQGLREKKMGKVIDDGEPEMLQEINQIKTERAMTEKKMKEVDDTLEKRSSALHDHATRLENAKNEWKKMTEEGTKQGVRIEAVSVDKDPTSAHGVLQANKAGLVKTINLLKTRYNVTLGEYAQKKTAMQKQISAVAESLQAKNE